MVIYNHGCDGVSVVCWLRIPGVYAPRSSIVGSLIVLLLDFWDAPILISIVGPFCVPQAGHNCSVSL